MQRTSSGLLPPINTEVDHRGQRYHVQTEDLGHRSAAVLTEVFQAGRIVFSKKVPYPSVSPIEQPQRVLELMREGHKSGMRAIVHEDTPTPPVAFTPSPPREGEMTKVITGRWDRFSSRPEMCVFLLSPTPVTNAEYEKYIEASSQTPSATWNRLMRADEPVTGLSLEEARAYAKWKGCRLPKESEIRAARRVGAIAPVERELYEWTEVDAGEALAIDPAWAIFRCARDV